MTARPPPLPVDRGELRIEKWEGVRLCSVEGRESGESQVSERVRMLSLLSDINSWREAGLSSSGVTVVIDLELRCEIFMRAGDVGPGLISMSPARRRMIDNSRE